MPAGVTGTHWYTRTHITAIEIDSMYTEYRK